MKCTNCGCDLSFNRAFIQGKLKCEKCVEKQKKEILKTEEDIKNKMDAEKKQLQEERERKIEELLLDKVEETKRKLLEGLEFFMYKSVYISVDSILLKESLAEGFDISVIQAFGIEGWDIVGVVPKTIGIGLENVSIGHTSGQTWGGGSGGNILGVHVLLKKKLLLESQTFENDLREYLLPLIEKSI